MKDKNKTKNEGGGVLGVGQLLTLNPIIEWIKIVTKSEKKN